ncbi:MAG: SusC/RagA family TonB-linked outer membrane protein [Clostridium sp.]|nr:SusC/RagA family TonB-linked outer membrane protein [Bacteroides sp.]MCM1197358.1 SusC/RagA family TonB-linked outer membrane protein [Clostridium sp.]
MIRKYIFAALSVLGCPALLHAQTDTLMIDLGYGLSVEKTVSSYAADAILADDIAISGEKNLLNTLYGRMPGLFLMQGSSVTGSQAPSAVIRGFCSTQGSHVIVLVDGVEREINDIDVEEVASVTVLKDAASLVLYGNRGADGAIYITTRQGGNQRARVKAGYDFGISTPFRVPEMADALQYANAVNEALANDGLAPRYTAQEIAAIGNGTSALPAVDWKSLVLRSMAYSHDLNLSVDGSSRRARYYVFANFNSNRGLFNNTGLNDGYSTNLEVYSLKLRANLEAMVTNTTRVRINLMGRLSQNQQPAGGVDLAAMYNMPSLGTPVYAPDGTWAKAQMFDNPLAAKAAQGYSLTMHRTLFADLELSQDLKAVTEGLSLTAKVSYDNSADIFDSRSKSYAYSTAVPEYDADGNVSGMSYPRYGNDTELAFASTLNWQVMRTYISARLDWKRSFGGHGLRASAIYSQGEARYLGANNTDRFCDWILSAGYSWSDKYIVDLVLDCSGSPKLPHGDKYRLYPALSAAWIISREDFMKNDGTVDLLKIRVSAGVTGQDCWLGYDMDIRQNPINTNSYVFVGNVETLGAAEGAFPSYGVEPARDYKVNAGVELGLYGGLSFQADAFWFDRKNISVSGAGTISSVLGLTAPTLFTGEVRGYGVEASADWTRTHGRFSYCIGGTFSYAHNSIVNMEEEYHPYGYMYYTGHSVGQFYGLVADGLYQPSDFNADGTLVDGVPSSTYTANLQPGDVKYRDMDNDGKIDAYDAAYQLFSNIPEINYGIRIGIGYAGFGVDALFHGSARSTVSTALASVWQPLYGNSRNISGMYLADHWTAATPDAKYPRLTTLPDNHNFRESSLWTERGDFFKLRSLDIHYDLPEKVVSRMRMSQFRIYLRGLNLFSADYVGIMDPEQITAGYPSLRSYYAGIKLTF